MLPCVTERKREREREREREILEYMYWYVLSICFGSCVPSIFSRRLKLTVRRNTLTRYGKPRRWQASAEVHPSRGDHVAGVNEANMLRLFGETNMLRAVSESDILRVFQNRTKCGSINKRTCCHVFFILYIYIHTYTYIYICLCVHIYIYIYILYIYIFISFIC